MNNGQYEDILNQYNAAAPDVQEAAKALLNEIQDEFGNLFYENKHKNISVYDITNNIISVDSDDDIRDRKETKAILYGFCTDRKERRRKYNMMLSNMIYNNNKYEIIFD